LFDRQKILPSLASQFQCLIIAGKNYPNRPVKKSDIEKVNPASLKRFSRVVKRWRREHILIEKQPQSLLWGETN
jgi:hypothetical protein